MKSKLKTWRYVTKEKYVEDGYSQPLLEGEVKARDLGHAIDQIRHILRHGDESGWTWQLADANEDGSATVHVKLYLMGTRFGQRDRKIGEFTVDNRAVPVSGVRFIRP
jgi:hypothetical protein